MTSAALDATADFDGRTAGLRRELLAYCYRLLGGLDDAEDAVQETYLRAWRSYPGFDERSSLRTWLYRIATNVCLTTAERRGRRPLPSGLADASTPGPVGGGEGTRWLQPIPDTVLDPADIAERRAGLRLALVAAMQHLPARQRAVLVLRDVLGWPAADVAELLGLSVAAVKSALQRARSRLQQLAPTEAEVTEPAVLRTVVDRYAAAFERSDAAGLAGLLRSDVTLEMPPQPAWYAGRPAVLGFLTAHVLDGGPVRMVVTGANGQPAVADYRDGAAHGVHLLDVADGRVRGIVVFLDPDLFTRLGLPTTC